MNVLDLIRSRMLRDRRLEDAQFLMAKAYRGVPYVDAHHDEPDHSNDAHERTYRGQHYVH
ncbi:MAG: hypothetical protein ACKO5F_01245 [Synechococcus sp.]